jgi:hypothetical protein
MNDRFFTMNMFPYYFLWKVPGAVNMERNAAENADTPPSYYEATCPHTTTPTQAPPEYSEVVIKQPDK